MRRRRCPETNVSALSGLFSALLVLAACGEVTAPTIEDPPNIVLILVDDLRWDALGVTGHPFSVTPNIDRLASEGMLFENAFVVHSVQSELADLRARTGDL